MDVLCGRFVPEELRLLRDKKFDSAPAWLKATYVEQAEYVGVAAATENAWNFDANHHWHRSCFEAMTRDPFTSLKLWSWDARTQPFAPANRRSVMNIKTGWEVHTFVVYGYMCDTPNGMNLYVREIYDYGKYIPSYADPDEAFRPSDKPNFCGSFGYASTDAISSPVKDAFRALLKASKKPSRSGVSGIIVPTHFKDQLKNSPFLVDKSTFDYAYELHLTS